MNSRLSAFVLPLVAIVVYVLIDFGYVFLVKDKYAEVVRNIQRGEEMKLDLIAAISCYLLMAIGWFFVAVQLAISYYATLKQRMTSLTPLGGTVLGGLIAGFFYGLVVYGVYDLTTRTLFGSKYPISLVVQDMAWGTLYNSVFTAIYMILWRKLATPAEL